MQATACLKIGPTDEPVMEEDRHPFCLPRKAARISFCPFLTVGFEGKNQCLCSKEWRQTPRVCAPSSSNAFCYSPLCLSFSQWGGSFPLLSLVFLSVKKIK